MGRVEGGGSADRDRIRLEEWEKDARFVDIRIEGVWVGEGVVSCHLTR